MLLNLSKKTWTEGLLLQDFENQAASNDKVRGAGGLAACVWCLVALRLLGNMYGWGWPAL
jgi:hypothetical protein